MPRLIRYSWLNRVVPPIIVVTVASCVWYAWKNHSVLTPYQPQPTTNSELATVTHSVPTPAEPVNTVVTKQGSELQFSLKTQPYQNVQRVEFYVENQFMGAAFTQPYSISVQESNLTAGSHTVSAKIVTADKTATAVPATFTTQPAPPATATTPPTPDTKPVVISTPLASHIAAPTGVTAVAGSDGSSATLTWAASDSAAQYQIWRDGTQVALATGTSYADAGLTGGEAYAYQVVAVDNAGNASDFSTAVSVTTPAPTPEDGSGGSGGTTSERNSTMTSQQQTSGSDEQQSAPQN